MKGLIMKQLKVEIPDFLHKKIKEAALAKDMTVKQLLIQTIVAMLTKEKMMG
jgi:hypothetical protein